MTNQGKFIVVEGPNGSGKTTALKATAARLREAGYSVVETREPGGTALAEHLRSIILDSRNRMDTVTQILLFNAGRRSHLQDVVLPQVEAGKIVLCDRYVGSTMVFQSLQLDAPPAIDKIILDAHRAYCDNLFPDLTFYLDAPLDVLLARRTARDSAADRFEEIGHEFELACIRRFREVPSLLGAPHETIDANQPLDRIVASMVDAITKHREMADA